MIPSTHSIAALCARGKADLAAVHITRACSYGVNRRQVLEAISCILPMTGALTVQIGARAMRQAETAAKPGRKAIRTRACRPVGKRKR